MSKSTISRDEKRRQVEAKEGGAGGVGPAVDGQESVDGVDAAAPVRVSMWAGMRNYECELCAYATLDGEGMAGHLRAVHGWRGTVVVASAAVAGEDEDEDDQDEVM